MGRSSFIAALIILGSSTTTSAFLFGHQACGCPPPPPPPPCGCQAAQPQPQYAPPQQVYVQPQVYQQVQQQQYYPPPAVVQPQLAQTYAPNAPVRSALSETVNAAPFFQQQQQVPQQQGYVQAAAFAQQGQEQAVYGQQQAAFGQQQGGYAQPHHHHHHHHHNQQQQQQSPYSLSVPQSQGPQGYVVADSLDLNSFAQSIDAQTQTVQAQQNSYARPAPTVSHTTVQFAQVPADVALNQALAQQIANEAATFVPNNGNAYAQAKQNAFALQHNANEYARVGGVEGGSAIRDQYASRPESVSHANAYALKKAPLPALSDIPEVVAAPPQRPVFQPAPGRAQFHDPTDVELLESDGLINPSQHDSPPPRTESFDTTSLVLPSNDVIASADADAVSQSVADLNIMSAPEFEEAIKQASLVQEQPLPMKSSIKEEPNHSVVAGESEFEGSPLTEENLLENSVDEQPQSSQFFEPSAVAASPIEHEQAKKAKLAAAASIQNIQQENKKDLVAKAPKAAAVPEVSTTELPQAPPDVQIQPQAELPQDLELHKLHLEPQLAQDQESSNQLDRESVPASSVVTESDEEDIPDSKRQGIALKTKVRARGVPTAQVPHRDFGFARL